MAEFKGFTIERGGLVSNEMFFSSLISDLCKDGAFTPVYTDTAGEIVANTMKATLEFTADALADTQPWRLQIDATVIDSATPGTGGQIIAGTHVQLPNDGTCYDFDGIQRDSEVVPVIAGKLGVNKSVVTGMKPLPDMFDLTMRITGGLINLNGRMVYIADNNALLTNTYEPSTITDVGIDTEGNLEYGNPDSFIKLFKVYTNAEGVYDVQYNDINWQSVSFVEPTAITAATPFSYRLTVTSRGMYVETWQNANFKERFYSWFCIQRLADPLAGTPLLSGHTPVVCTYSFNNNNMPYMYDVIANSIFKIVVRENDVMAPTKPTVVSANSDYVNAMFNPMKQISTSESNQYYVIFPSGMNTQRHLYNEEMDMIAFTSAGVISQWNDAVINVYGECEIAFENGKTELNVPGARLLYVDPVSNTTSCAFVKKLIPDPLEYTGTEAEIKTAFDAALTAGTAKGKIIAYELNGAFPSGIKLKVGAIDVCDVLADHKLIYRKYKGGNANYGTAEGMRILFLTENGDVDTNLGILVGDTRIPSTPINLTTVQELDTANVQVSWDIPLDSSPATSWDLYYSEVATFKITDSGVTSVLEIPALDSFAGEHVVENLDPGKTLYFRVRAKGTDGTSLACSAVAQYIEDPATPLGVVSLSGAWSNTVTWDLVAGADTYNIYWRKGANVEIDATTKMPKNTATKIPLVADSPYLHGDTDIANAAGHLSTTETYYYVVTSVTAGVESLPSAEVMGLPTDPTPPKNVTVTADIDGFKNNIVWDAVTGATSYNVYWSKTAGQVTALMTKVAAPTFAFAHTGLTAGVPYYYKITANFAGNIEGTASTETSGIPSDPKQPKNVTVTTGGTGSLSVSWNLVPGATGYNVYWADGQTPIPGQSAVTAVTPPASTLVFSKPAGAASGRTYHFVVTATTLSGESIASAEATGVL